MKWFKGQIGWILTAITLLIAAGISYGRIHTLCGAIDGKADKGAVTRELDQIQDTLDRIETKLDNHMTPNKP